jgi:hypothetical protein
VSRNDSNRDSDYMLKSDARVRSVRRDAENAENITTVGYVPGSDQTRAFPGDEKFPFVKDVPDVTGPTLYRPLDKLNPAEVFADYETLPSVDVRGHRAFALFGVYTPGQIQGVGTGLLSLVVEAALEPVTATAPSVQTWYPIGVVDPTLNAPAIEPGFAYRRFYASEFRLDPWAGFTPPFPLSGPIPFTLIYDVSWYRDVRVRCAELSAAATSLRLNYMRMR